MQVCIIWLLVQGAFLVARKRVHYMLVNLRIAYPEWSDRRRRALARASWVQLAWNAIDVIRASRWSAQDFEAHVSVEGLEHLEKAMAAGKGALGLSLHMGNFELGVRRIPLLGYPLSGVARPMQNVLIRDHIFAQRQSTGAQLIPSKGAAPKMSRALKQGHLVPALNDQYVRPSNGVLAPLFGARCSTSQGVAALALRRRAPIVPCYIVRDGSDHHRLIFLPPIQIALGDGKRRDSEAVTIQCNAVLEEIIRAHPEQWMWSHRRFRYSPDLPEAPYELHGLR